MKTKLFFIALSILLAASVTPVYCSDQKTGHNYNGHFGDMDTDGDDQLNWKEFKQYFTHAEEHVFKKADVNNDSIVDHDEWHEFKEVHGYGHIEKE